VNLSFVIRKDGSENFAKNEEFFEFALQGCKDASADARARADKKKGRGFPAFLMILSLRLTATDCDGLGLGVSLFGGHFDPPSPHPPSLRQAELLRTSRLRRGKPAPRSSLAAIAPPGG
jgi:hypothetical protein